MTSRWIVHPKLLQRSDPEVTRRVQILSWLIPASTLFVIFVLAMGVLWMGRIDRVALFGVTGFLASGLVLRFTQWHLASAVIFSVTWVAGLPFAIVDMGGINYPPVAACVLIPYFLVAVLPVRWAVAGSVFIALNLPVIGYLQSAGLLPVNPVRGEFMPVFGVMIGGVVCLALYMATRHERVRRQAILSRENEREMELEQRRLRSLGELTRQFWHQINTPLGVIAAGTRMLEKKTAQKMTSHWLDYLETVKSETAKIAGTLRAHRIYINHVSGTGIRAADPVVLVNDALGPVQEEMRLKGVRTDLVDRLSPGIHVLVASEKLAQALMNLFWRALDSSPRGGNIRVTLEDSEGCVQIRISGDREVVSPSGELDHSGRPELEYCGRVIEEAKGRFKVHEDLESFLYVVALPQPARLAA